MPATGDRERDHAMLDSLGKKAGKWVVQGLLLLLVASFGLWGIGDYVTGRFDSNVASVGGIDISARDYSREVNRELQAVQGRLGTILDQDQIRSLGIHQRALQTLVARALIDQSAQDLGLAVTDEVVVRQIRRAPEFQGATGQFDRFRFEQVLARNGWSEQAYIRLMRADLARQQLLRSLNLVPGEAPKYLVDRIYRYRMERRKTRYLVLPNDAAGEIASPTEEDLAKFHEQNSDVYTSPEFRRVTFLTLAPADLVDEIEVSDEDLQAEYNARADEFITPASREVRQLVFDSAERAQAAYDRVKAGEDLASVAADMLGQTAADISLGRVTRDDLLPELADAVFALGDGETTPPTQSPFGWHVIQVSGIEAGGQTPLAEVRDKLRADVALRLAEDRLFDLANTLDDRLAGGATLEEAAADLPVRIQTLAAIDNRGRTPDDVAAPGLPTQPEFIQTVFETEPGTEPVLNESTDGSYFLLRVDDSTPPRLKPLAEVRAAVISAWTKQQRETKARALAQKLVERLKGGTGLDAIARELELPVATSEPFTRSGGGDPAISAELRQEIFGAQAGDAVAAAHPDQPAQVIAVLDEILPADPAIDPDRLRQLAAQVASSYQNDALQQFQVAVQSDIDVRINAQAVDQVVNPGAAQR